MKIRMLPYDPREGYTLQRYAFKPSAPKETKRPSKFFEAGKVYEVSAADAKILLGKRVRTDSTHPRYPLAFEQVDEATPVTTPKKVVVGRGDLKSSELPSAEKPKAKPKIKAAE